MKQHIIVRAAVALLAASVFGLSQVGVASADGGNSANAKLCQKGGWQTLHNSATGVGFSNEGACVSYGAKGGEYSSLKWTATVSGGSVTLSLSGFGLEPRSQYDYGGSESFDNTASAFTGFDYVSADGTISGPSSPSITAPCGHHLSVSATAITSGGATISTGTVKSPCE
jgi:hypothetical protein